MESSQNPTRLASTPKKSIARKKSSKGSKGSSTSADQEPFLCTTNDLYSINTLDYDEPIRLMIEFIAKHPISIPLAKIPKPPLALHHLPHAFTSIRLKDDTLETTIIGDRIVPIYKSTFLKAIGVKSNPRGFIVVEPTTEEFQTFLTYIGYTKTKKPTI